MKAKIIAGALFALWFAYLTADKFLFGGKLGRLLADGYKQLFSSFLRRLSAPFSSRGKGPESAPQHPTDPGIIIVKNSYGKGLRGTTGDTETKQADDEHTFEGEDEQSLNIRITYKDLYNDEDESIQNVMQNDTPLRNVMLRFAGIIAAQRNASGETPPQNARETMGCIKGTDLYNSLITQMNRDDTVADLLDKTLTGETSAPEEAPSKKNKRNAMADFDINDFLPHV